MPILKANPVAKMTPEEYRKALYSSKIVDKLVRLMQDETMALKDAGFSFEEAMNCAMAAACNFLPNYVMDTAQYRREASTEEVMRETAKAYLAHCDEGGFCKDVEPYTIDTTSPSKMN